MEIKLGCTYKDKITGFVGIATGYVEYISGCNQVLLTPKVGMNNGLNEPTWFDVQRLDQVTHEPRIILDNGSTPGCDMAAPIR